MGSLLSEGKYCRGSLSVSANGSPHIRVLIQHFFEAVIDMFNACLKLLKKVVINALYGNLQVQR